MTYTIKDEIIPKGKQRYFFIAITEEDKLEIINELPTQKFTGQKTIDIYTANHTKDEIVKQLEKKLHTKLKAIRLGYRRDDGKIVLLGMVVDNKEFAESIKNFERRKVDHINRNSKLFAKELNEFENTIINNINEIERIYGIKSSIYEKAVNYKKNKDFSMEHRILLIEEFSRYTNFRKWLTRKTEAIYPKVEQNPNQGQITIEEYLNNIPQLNTKNDELMEEHKEELKEQREKLLNINIQDPNREEFLEMGDFAPGYDLGDWKPRVRKKR